MKIQRHKQKYGESTPFKWVDNYEFCLHRLDWNMVESVFFNRKDVTAVLSKIVDGHILVHYNYSILFCKNEDAEKIAPNFGCHTCIQKEDDN